MWLLCACARRVAAAERQEKIWDCYVAVAAFAVCVICVTQFVSNLSASAVALNSLELVSAVPAYYIHLLMFKCESKRTHAKQMNIEKRTQSQTKHTRKKRTHEQRTFKHIVTHSQQIYDHIIVRIRRHFALKRANATQRCGFRTRCWRVPRT